MLDIHSKLFDFVEVCCNKVDIVVEYFHTWMDSLAQLKLMFMKICGMLILRNKFVGQILINQINQIMKFSHHIDVSLGNKL